MITNEQISNLTDTQKDLLLLNLITRLSELEAKVRKLNLDRFSQRLADVETKGIGEDTEYKSKQKELDETKEYPAVDTAPEWDVWFKLNTSLKEIEITIPQKAWTEKQAIFLARTEVLFPSMCKQVKEKRIEAKWSILDAVATKA